MRYNITREEIESIYKEGVEDEKRIWWYNCMPFE